MSWSEQDLATKLKGLVDLLTTLYNKQRVDMRNTSKCITQINNLKQVQKSFSIDTEGKTIINYKNPENPAGNIMNENYRNEQVTALEDNIEAYLQKFD